MILLSCFLSLSPLLSYITVCCLCRHIVSMHNVSYCMLLKALSHAVFFFMHSAVSTQTCCDLNNRRNDPFRLLNLLFTRSEWSVFYRIHFPASTVAFMVFLCHVFIVCVRTAGLLAYIITQCAHTVCVFCITVSMWLAIDLCVGL